MNTIAITGASGVVGRRVVQHLLAREDVERVVALSRRPLDVQHPKLVFKVVDMSSQASMAGALPDGIAVALCCLGTTMKKAGSKAAFRAVDHDAVLAFAQAAIECGARRFVLVSSVGVNAKAPNFYLRTKGETEQALAELGFEQVTFLRPSFIDDQGTRAEYRLAERLALPFARFFFSVFARNSRYAPITADTLGKAMVRLALDDTVDRLRVLEGKNLREHGR